MPDPNTNNDRANEEAPDYGRPMSFGTTPSHTIEELAKMQGVKPFNPDGMLGAFDDLIDDEFMASIEEARRFGMTE